MFPHPCTSLPFCLSIIMTPFAGVCRPANLLTQAKGKGVSLCGWEMVGRFVGHRSSIPGISAALKKIRELATMQGLGSLVTVYVCVCVLSRL